MHTNDFLLETNPIKCTMCEKSFSTKRDLNGHFLAIHDMKNAPNCTMCKKSFSRKEHLKRHLANIHKGAKP